MLAKGRPPLPAQPISDASSEWVYTGNKLHPTQKPVEVLEPLIRTYCPAGGLVLDPFCEAVSTLVAANACRRDYLGIELDAGHAAMARARIRYPSWLPWAYSCPLASRAARSSLRRTGKSILSWRRLMTPRSPLSSSRKKM
ncbi:DNA methyltransferase [Shinella oryzae]|uniref:DNA methyltransferase n=1 Tax=Shinella oryzae TaxID=2871820 RepID=UPI003514A2A7